jgi:hypothetical protein
MRDLTFLLLVLAFCIKAGWPASAAADAGVIGRNDGNR